MVGMRDTSPWISGTPAPPMDVLLPAALQALEAEDRLLGLAFAQGASLQRKARPAEGLTYYLYETTLAYIIFRAWVPVVDVEWECRYTPGTCDLVVRGADTRNIYIELKWWNNAKPETLQGLRNDTERLRSVREGADCYLIAFWWNYNDADWERDRVEFVDKAHELDTEPMYLGRFSTRRERDVPACYFAMATFRVR
jgi:hypothetical protein